MSCQNDDGLRYLSLKYLFSFSVPLKHSCYSDFTMNIHQAQIEKFNVLANEWWNHSGVFKSLHEINALRLNWIEKQISLPGKKIVDIGCGGGILAEAIASKGGDVTGIDIAKEVIDIAKSHSVKSGLSIQYHVTTAEEMAKKEFHQYDIVTCMEMLEHTPNPESVVKACAHLAKPGGYIFFSTLNRNFKSFVYAIIGAEYILQLLPKGTHRHSQFITPAELSRYARKAGLSIANITGITSNLLGRNFKLSKNMDVNYMLSFAKPF